MAVTFSRLRFLATKDSFLYFPYLLSTSELFSPSYQPRQSVYSINAISNRTLELLEEGLAYGTRRGARRRRATPRILFKPAHRFLLSGMTLSSFNRFFFLCGGQNRIPDSRTRRSEGRLQPGSQESGKANGVIRGLTKTQIAMTFSRGASGIPSDDTDNVRLPDGVPTAPTE